MYANAAMVVRRARVGFDRDEGGDGAAEPSCLCTAGLTTMPPFRLEDPGGKSGHLTLSADWWRRSGSE